MTVTPHLSSRIALLAILSLCSSSSSALLAEQILVTIDSRFDLERVETRDVTATVVVHGDRHVLRLETGHQDKWPGITLHAREGMWDVSKYKHLVVEVKNAGNSEVNVGMRADSQDA